MILIIVEEFQGNFSKKLINMRDFSMKLRGFSMKMRDSSIKIEEF